MFPKETSKSFLVNMLIMKKILKDSLLFRAKKLLMPVVFKKAYVYFPPHDAMKN